MDSGGESSKMEDQSETVDLMPHGNNEKETLLIQSKRSPTKEKPTYSTFGDTDTSVDVGGEFPDQTDTAQMKTKLKPLHLDIASAAKHNKNHLLNNVQDIQTPTGPGTSETPKSINVAIFLKEGEGHLLQLEKGKLTTAGEIKSMMLEILSIPKSASKVFSMWMVSPYLEIQLKGHHIPYLLRKQWRDMLIEFSSCQDQVLAVNVEPVLVFQRNSFCSVKDEEMETDETVIKRLFAEARYNILNAKYPIPVADAEILGGLLVRIDLGPYSSSFKPGYLRKQLSKFLPYYAIGSNKIIQQFRITGTEQRLRDQHEHATKKRDSILACQIKFLEYCRSLPYYGCAFFRGKVLQEFVSWKIWKSSEKEIVVGINRNGITVFKSLMEVVLMHIAYDDLSWEYLKEDGSPDAFCIEYDVTNTDGETEPQQIQILSRQSCMMDCMVDSCVQFLNVMNVPKTPTSADYSKVLNISYSTFQSDKKHNFSLSRPFKR